MLTLGQKEIHLWFTSELDIAEGVLTDDYLALLSNAERQRHRRFLFPRHRHRFLVTRALVRSVLGQYEYTDTAASIDFGQNDYGKPHLNGNNSGLHFNVSHTEGLIVLAVVLDHDLGVDVETVVRRAEIMKLAQRYFSPHEFRAMEDLNSRLAHERFFELWTLKESYIKACGQGLTIPLEEFSFTLEEKRISIRFSPQRNDSPEKWRFWQLLPAEHYRLALALTGKELDGFRLTCYRGIPLQGFEQNRPQLLRSSA